VDHSKLSKMLMFVAVLFFVAGFALQRSAGSADLSLHRGWPWLAIVYGAAALSIIAGLVTMRPSNGR